MQRDKNDNAGHIILPLVNKTEENVVFPLVLNVISRFWGEEIPRLMKLKKELLIYKNFKGIVFIEGLEIIEKKLNLSSIVYRGSISDIKKRVNQGFPVIVVLPGIGDIVQFATIVCGYDDNEKELSHISQNLIHMEQFLKINSKKNGLRTIILLFWYFQRI